MTWIRTIPMSETSESDIGLRAAYAALAPLYPPEYGQPSPLPELAGESIVASHSLLPEAMRHAFSTYGALLGPDLPLSRRRRDDATLVSVEPLLLNRIARRVCERSAWMRRWSRRSAGIPDRPTTGDLVSWTTSATDARRDGVTRYHDGFAPPGSKTIVASCRHIDRGFNYINRVADALVAG